MVEVPKVAVVVLNYNGEAHLRVCIPSLLATQYQNLDLLVVDNGSQDGSLAYLHQVPEVTLLALPKNLGFVKGNNRGMRLALKRGAEILVLLNNDTRVDPDWIANLVSAFQSDSSIGMAGSKILTWDGTLIEFDGTVFDQVLAAGGYVYIPVESETVSRHDAPYACGAALAIRSSLLAKIGFLDPAYFIYNEDVDLSLRCWIAGYRVVYVPESIVYHHRGGSGLGSEWCRYVSMRNALATILKNYQCATIRLHAHQLWRIYWQRAESHLRKAILVNGLRLPLTLIKRWKVQHSRRISDAQLFQRFAEAATPAGLRLCTYNDQGGEISGELYGSNSCGQSFTCPDDYLTRIDLFMATYNRVNPGLIRFHLRCALAESPEQDLVLIERRMDSIKDNAYHSFEFEPIADSGGKDFYYYLEAPDATAGAGVTVWCSPYQSSKAGTRYRNHQPTTGALQFRAYAKQMES